MGKTVRRYSKQYFDDEKDFSRRCKKASKTHSHINRRTYEDESSEDEYDYFEFHDKDEKHDY